MIFYDAFVVVTNCNKFIGRGQCNSRHSHTNKHTPTTTSSKKHVEKLHVDEHILGKCRIRSCWTKKKSTLHSPSYLLYDIFFLLNWRDYCCSLLFLTHSTSVLGKNNFIHHFGWEPKQKLRSPMCISTDAKDVHEEMAKIEIR